MSDSKLIDSKNIPFILKHFFKDIENDPGSDTNVSAICKTCSKKLKGSLFATTNFLNHLKRKGHSDLFAEYEKLKIEYSKKRKFIGDTDDEPNSSKKMLQTSIQPTISSNSIHFDKLLLNFLVDTMSPISIVENKSFKDLIEGAQQLSVPPKIMNRKICKEKIAECSSSIQSLLACEQLQESVLQRMTENSPASLRNSEEGTQLFEDEYYQDDLDDNDKNIEIYDDSKISYGIKQESPTYDYKQDSATLDIKQSSSNNSNITPVSKISNDVSTSTCNSGTPYIYLSTNLISNATSFNLSLEKTIIPNCKKRKYNSCEEDHTESKHEFAEIMNQPNTTTDTRNSLSDTINNFGNFIVSLLHTIVSEEIKLELMNKITQMSFTARLNDLQNSRSDN